MCITFEDDIKTVFSDGSLIYSVQDESEDFIFDEYTCIRVTFNERHNRWFCELEMEEQPLITGFGETAKEALSHLYGKISRLEKSVEKIIKYENG